MVEGHEVEQVEVSIVGVGPVHRDQVLGGVVGQPAVQDVRADGGLVDLAAPDHLGAVDLGLGVVDAADRLDKDVVGVVVLGVLGHDPAFQRDVLGQVERAAAVQRLGRGGELVAHLLQQGAVGRLVGQVDQQAQKAGEVVRQSIGQGVLVHRLDPHRVKVHRREGLGVCAGGADRDHAVRVHRVGGAVVLHQAAVGVGQVDLVVVVGFGPGDVGSDQTHVGGRVGGVEQVAQGIHKVLRGDGGHHFAVHVHPVFVPQVEGPGQGGLVELPLGGQALPHDALVVVFHQGVDAVGAHHHLDVGGGGQVVQSRGLAGIQDGVAGGVRRGGAPARGGAARTAGAEQPGGAGGGGGHAGGLEELPAGKGMTHKKLPFSFILWPG